MLDVDDGNTIYTMKMQGAHDNLITILFISCAHTYV